jgi:NitT/TauT family transport system ATP-binding protein/sulfonate transport system ATP-binding protein
MKDYNKTKTSLPVVVEVKNATREFRDDRGNGIIALDNVSLSVKQGEFVSLIGPSGCGKTSLLRLIAGLDAPQVGEILTDGEPVTGTSHERGYVFQQANLFPWKTVEENVAFGLRARGVYAERRPDVAEYLAMAGLKGFERAYPHQISGGMTQRAALVRSLINRPKVLLLDEPMGALDSFTRMDLQEKLLELWQSFGTTMILVTHDIDEAVYLSERVVIMTPRPGKISEIIETSSPFPRNRSSASFVELRNRVLEKFHLAGAESSVEYSI